MALIAAEVADHVIRRNSTDRPGGRHNLAAGDRGTGPDNGDSPRQGRPSSSQFVVIGIALAIGLIVVVTSGRIAEGTFLALLVFILAGAIAPPIAIPVGAIILLAQLMRGDVGTKFFSWLGSLSSAAPPAPGPKVPGMGPVDYLPSKSIGTV